MDRKANERLAEIEYYQSVFSSMSSYMNIKRLEFLAHYGELRLDDKDLWMAYKKDMQRTWDDLPGWAQVILEKYQPE